jgi:hypothetical protein
VPEGDGTQGERLPTLAAHPVRRTWVVIAANPDEARG